jgi:hypothetical protein
MKKFPLLVSFKNPANLAIFAGFSLLFFSINYWVMKNLPGTDGYQCLPDSLTRENIIFAVIISLIMGAFIVGMKELFSAKKSATQKVSSASIFSIGGIVSLFTIFCPVCTIGVVSIFGISFGLNFFVENEFSIKIATILLLIFGLYWINGQLKPEECEICKFVAPKK